MYEYRARVLRLIDGDTVEAELELGFHITFTATLRLYGINAPEVHGTERPQGLEATRYLRDQINERTGGTGELVVRTQKDKTGKYGRYLATLITGDVNLNEALVDSGHAVVAMY